MTAPNLLTLRGHIDVRTMWPDGASDADTLRLFVDPSTTWATLRKNGVTRPVRRLDRAVVHGSVVRPVLSPTKAITIRLQGVDAPELHYRAPSPPRADQLDDEPRYAPTYRQSFGETTSAALHDYLISHGELLEVEATSQVDRVGDAFDTYGRFVGDVFVLVDNKRLHLNRWLVARGWAFPAFYTSMTIEEIDLLTNLAQRACEARRGVWGNYASLSTPPDPRRLYRGKHVTLHEESGAVGLPKLFRRRVAWREANLNSGPQRSFPTYLRSRADRVVLRDEFLTARQGGAAIETRPLVDLMNGNELIVSPWDLVFEERPAAVRFR